MKLSLPFLATCEAQLPKPGDYDHYSVEGVLFERSSLQDSVWKEAWRVLALASKWYGASNVTFHFPINDCEYVSDNFVYKRLCEAVCRAIELGLNGVVVHSNRVLPITDWQKLSVSEERIKVIDRLLSVPKTAHTGTWLALENMPAMDNNAFEIDPLFLYPADFKDVCGSGLGIVWDVCHYSITETAVSEILKGEQSVDYYPNFRSSPGNLSQLKSDIRHWHFSAFKGIANPATLSRCEEGIHPALSTLGEDYYLERLKEIFQVASDQSKITLEIREDDYLDRRNFKRVKAWIDSCLSMTLPFPRA